MIRTTFALLKASHAQQSRVNVLAHSLGGMEKYGMDTPITIEQIQASNGRADADWVKDETSVHLVDTHVVDTGTQNQSKAESKEVKVTKKLEEAFAAILAIEGIIISSTVSKKDQARTTTIKVRTLLGSPLGDFIAACENIHKESTGV